MQRLILMIEQGDGYTYGYQEAFPIVYRSKEEFLIALEDKLIETQAELEKQQKVINSKQEEIRLLIAYNKRKDAKGIGYSEKLAPLMVENGQLCVKLSETTYFMLGGQRLNMSFFGYSEENKSWQMPEILTLDEYFAEVENNV